MFRVQSCLSRHSVIRRDRESGTSAVEATIVMPLLVLITLGVFEFGLFFWNTTYAQSASSSAARTGVTFTWNTATKTWGLVTGVDWLATNQAACGPVGSTDFLGVQIRFRHNSVTGALLRNKVITVDSVMRLEPVSISTAPLCASRRRSRPTHSCAVADPQQCRTKIRMSFNGGAQPTDQTTWSAIIEGDPIRLV